MYGNRLAVVALGSALLISAIAAPAAQPSAPTALSAQQTRWLESAGRRTQDGWVWAHLEGSARQIGFQHGYLLAKEIDTAIKATRLSWQYDTAVDWAWLVEQAAAMFMPKIDAQSMAELEGIAEGLRAAGVKTTTEEVIAYNGILELSSYWWPKYKGKLGGKAPEPRQACSAVIATGSMTRDGQIVLGHNSMFGYAEAYFNVVLDIRPQSGHRVLMQAAPGWIHSGTDFFVTDAGLVGAETTIGGFKGFDEKGIPEFVRMRRATQDTATIDAWCETMKRGNNGGYANAWLLGDINTGEIARLELGLKYVSLEKTRDGFFVGSNVAENQKILRWETDVEETDIRLSSVARRVRWHQLMAQHAGRLDVALVQQFEADHYDTYRQGEHPGGRTLCSHGDWENEPSGSRVPFRPSGTIDAKVVDRDLAKAMSFSARWGAACGAAFDASEFLKLHPQFNWMEPILSSRPSQPWTIVRAQD